MKGFFITFGFWGSFEQELRLLRRPDVLLTPPSYKLKARAFQLELGSSSESSGKLPKRALLAGEPAAEATASAADLTQIGATPL